MVPIRAPQPALLWPPGLMFRTAHLTYSYSGTPFKSLELETPRHRTVEVGLFVAFARIAAFVATAPTPCACRFSISCGAFAGRTRRRSMSHRTLTAAVHRALTGRELLSHPFYVRWSKGELSRRELCDYAAQYRHVEAALPDLLRTIAGRTPNPDVSGPVLRN